MASPVFLTFKNKVKHLGQSLEETRGIESYLLPCAYLLVVAGLLYALFSHWAYDDPFITYRYSQNLAQGLGFVYNPGERVQSTTTPLFALILAPLSLLGADLSQLANLIGAASLALGAIFLWDLARTWKTPLAGWAGLLLYPTLPLLLSTLGSETPLYLALCLGAFALYARSRYGWAAALAALAVLARPDGALIPILLGADFLLRARRPVPWSAVFLFLAITLAWFGFAWLYYGSPLPATLAAKQQQGALANSERFTAGFITLLRDYTGQWEYILQAALACLGLLSVAGPFRRWGLFLSWPALYFVAYSALGVSRYYWYYAPLVPGFVILAGIGLEAIVGWLRNRSQPQPVERAAPSLNRPNASWSGVWAILPLLLIGLLAIAQGSDLLRLRQLSDRRALVYRSIGDWLNTHTSPSDTVGTLEVGIIGYYARRPMIDFAGLIQPETAAHLTIGDSYEAVALWAVERYRPDYLVLHDEIFPRLERDYAAQNCETVKRFRKKQTGFSQNLTIYACR